MSNYYDKETADIVTISGQTVPPATSGNFALNSDIFVSTVTSFVIPKGARLKMWSRLVAGPPCIVNYKFANDGSTFRTIVSDDLASSGDQDNEKRRPHVFRSYAGTEAIQLAYLVADGHTASTVVFDAEIVRDSLT